MHLLITSILVTLLFACNQNKESATSNESFSAEQYQMKAVATDATPAYNDISNESVNASASITDRKLIKNGSLEFKTEAVKKTKLEIEKLCKEFNAYISNENENNYGERLQYNQTIRVPAEKFDLLLTKIEGLASKIDTKNISTQDVTEEFIDVEARLKTKKELEQRYLEILKQARTVEEIISVESQIANVRAEIESMEGRLQFLKNQVALSTLNVSYYEVIGTDFGFAGKLGESLKGGWENLLSFIVFIITLWPFAIALVLTVIWWRRRKSKNGSNVS